MDQFLSPDRNIDTPTRRDALRAGVVGLLGMNLVRSSIGRAADHTDRNRQQDAGSATADPVDLQPGDPASVGVSAERLARITERLTTQTAGGGILSASVLVARKGTIVLHQGFGRLSPKHDSAQTQPDTIYLLASISKPITACSLMVLVERGKVLLSDPVHRYLPEFQGPGKEKIKVWHLLSHVSGLPDQLPENNELRRSHAPLSDFVKRTLQTPLIHEPGAQFSYQSMGTLLAGEIVERISGSRLRDFMKREQFEPLGMQRTFLGLGPLAIDETAIVQQTADTEDVRRWGPNSPYWRDMGHPWGGVHSTTSDLAILLQLFLNGGIHRRFRLFSPATTNAMTRDHNTDIKAPFGLGWALRDSKAGSFFGDLCSAATFGHVGATGTVAWADPVRGLICILLTTQPAACQDGVLLNTISNLAQAAVISA